MNLVNLVSGGLDSTLVGVLVKENNIKQYPLFIDYGQLAMVKEWDTCKKVHKMLNLPTPKKMDLSGFGKMIKTGLTNEKLDLKEEAFTPGRNLMFLLMGSAYAYQLNIKTVAIGLLSEEFSLFPDQTGAFIKQAESIINMAMGYSIQIITPLFNLNKSDVVHLSKEKGIKDTYSCHSGKEQACGKCIACLEFNFNQE